MSDYETHEHDVLVIGAGGAGLRAAIEAAKEGATVGVVCKSLLGKAHTVMAEGGVAAALGNVDDRDNWMVHFADTMRGGQYVNNWRMAELHAKEAPDRVRELEAWGAVFDRTPDGRILQRNFGGHKYPCGRRRAPAADTGGHRNCAEECGRPSCDRTPPPRLRARAPDPALPSRAAPPFASC